MGKTTKGGNGTAPVGEHERAVLRDLALHDAATAQRTAAIAALQKALEDALVASKGVQYPGTLTLTEQVIVKERELAAHVGVRSRLEAQLAPARQMDEAREAARPAYEEYRRQITPLLWKITECIEAAEPLYEQLRGVVAEAERLNKAHGFGTVSMPEIQVRKGFWASKFGAALKKHIEDRTPKATPAVVPSGALALGPDQR